MLQMSQYYEPKFKKKIVRIYLEEGKPSKDLLKNTVYPKQAYLFGPDNSVKNAKQMMKPKSIMIT